MQRRHRNNNHTNQGLEPLPRIAAARLGPTPDQSRCAVFPPRPASNCKTKGRLDRKVNEYRQQRRWQSCHPDQQGWWDMGDEGCPRLVDPGGARRQLDSSQRSNGRTHCKPYWRLLCRSKRGKLKQEAESGSIRFPLSQRLNHSGSNTLRSKQPLTSPAPLGLPSSAPFRFRRPLDCRRRPCHFHQRLRVVHEAFTQQSLGNQFGIRPPPCFPARMEAWPWPCDHSLAAPIPQSPGLGDKLSLQLTPPAA